MSKGSNESVTCHFRPGTRQTSNYTARNKQCAQMTSQHKRRECYILQILTRRIAPSSGYSIPWVNHIYRGPFRQWTPSEEISYFQFNHHFVSSSGARFHPNRINLRIWMVHPTASQPSQTLCRWLRKHRSAMTRRVSKGSLSKDWYSALRSITNAVISLVLLRGTVQLGIYSGNVSWYTRGRCHFCVLEYLDQVQHWNNGCMGL